MNLMKRIGTLAMAAAMTLSLAACGEKGPAPDEVINNAVEKINTVKSVDAKMSTEIGMTVAGNSMDMNINMDMSLFNDPMKAHVKMTTSGSANMGSIPEIEMYLEQDGDTYTTYVNNGSQWISQPLPAEQAAQFDPQASTDLYAKNAKNFKANGSEKIGEVQADRYDGVISGDDITEVLKSTNMLDSLQGMADESALAAMKDLADLKVSVWVDPASGYPVRFQVDMGEFMTKMMENIASAAGGTVSQLGLEISKAMITVDYSNFDAVEEFEIPAEAQPAA